LAWLKDRLIGAGGFVSVLSDGALYELGLLKQKVVENDAAHTDVPPNGDSSGKVPGVGVQLLLPLGAAAGAEIERYARWTGPLAQAGFFDAERPPLIVKRVPRELLQTGTGDAWAQFLESAETNQQGSLLAFDLAQEHATRTSLELFFAGVLDNKNLRGRVLVLNCHRHNASRLPTVQSAERFKTAGTLLPLFTPTLRTIFIGSDSEQDHALLQLLNSHPTDYRQIESLARANPLLFMWHDATPVGLNFTVTTLEEAMRSSLGEELVEVLSRDGHIHVGRFRLPFEPTKSRTPTSHAAFVNTWRC
jgi:hypothetical protein